MPLIQQLTSTPPLICQLKYCSKPAKGGALGGFCSRKCFKRYRICEHPDCPEQAISPARYCCDECRDDNRLRVRAAVKTIRLKVVNQDGGATIHCFCPFCEQTVQIDNVNTPKADKADSKPTIQHYRVKLRNFRRAHKVCIDKPSINAGTRR